MVPGAIVVLFKPSEEHVFNVMRLRRLCTHVIAIDNSPQPDLGVYARLASTGIDIVANFNQGAVAGAYNRDLERLIERGAQLLFIFDQDSDVPQDYFATMLATCRNLDSCYFLIGPKILDINVNRYMPAHVVSRFGLRSIPLSGENRGFLRGSSIISSGSAMSADTYRHLAPFPRITSSTMSIRSIAFERRAGTCQSISIQP